MSEWQPIGTAPKDEASDILVAALHEDGSCDMAVAQWWVASWASPSFHHMGMALLDFAPTHWQPLPEPPPA